MIPVEPSADLRQLASIVRQAHAAFAEQGYSEAEALYLAIELMRALLSETQ